MRIRLCKLLVVYQVSLLRRWRRLTASVTWILNQNSTNVLLVKMRRFRLSAVLFVVISQVFVLENVLLAPSCSLDLLVLVRQNWPRLWRKFSLMMNQLCFALICRSIWKNLRLVALMVLLQDMSDMMRVESWQRKFEISPTQFFSLTRLRKLIQISSTFSYRFWMTVF